GNGMTVSLPAGVSWVRLSFVDVFGGAHSVQLPADRFPIACDEGAPFDGSALEGRARHLESDMLLRPDASSLIALGDGMARAAADRLSGFGIEVLSCHHEAGPGQFELDLGPLPPLALADGLVLAKQVLKETAAAAGLRATFMARPFNGLPGSGLHLHQRVE